MKVGLDLSNYATKSDVDESYIDKLKNIPTSLYSLKSKVDNLDIDNLVPVPTDLSKISDVVISEVVKKTVYD